MKKQLARWKESNSKSKRPLVVWALFDDAESSYKNAFNKFFDKQFEVHSIGINNIAFQKSKYYFYHRIDLSLCNFNLTYELSKLPKPDIILASPPCECWSGADCGGVMFRSINKNGEWVVKNKKYYTKYNKTCHAGKTRSFIQKEASRILGEATIGATIEIIQYFKPRVWIIENPQTSKTWEYQKHHWNFDTFKNLTYYSAYDSSFNLKPTIFKSNLKLSLKTKRVQGNKYHMSRGSYARRSAIPSILIKDIIKQILSSKEIQNVIRN
jgi:hypothetical protein